MGDSIKRRYRIRRCNGNKAAWLLCLLDDTGEESEDYGSYATAMSIDVLLMHASYHLRPRPGDHVELQP